MLKENKETKIKNIWEDQFYQTLDNSIILHLPTTEFLIKKKDHDALTLFTFYCYCSKLQRNTRRVWASNDFVRKNLCWRKQKLLQIRKRLTNYGIIKAEPYREKDTQTNKESIKKWFVEIIPLLNAQNIFKSTEKESCTGSQSEKSTLLTKSCTGSRFVPVQNGNHSSILIRKTKFNTNKVSEQSSIFTSGKEKIVASDQKFDLKLKLQKYLIDPKRHIQIIALWIQEMKLTPENQDQLQSIIKRTVRAATDLKGYTNEKIIQTIKHIKELDYIERFTLETVAKYIDTLEKVVTETVDPAIEKLHKLVAESETKE